MNKQCSGCGAYFQIFKPEMPGYIEPEMLETATVCRRCFRLKNYGDYSFVSKNNDDYIDILNEINKTKDLVLYVVDIFHINNNTMADIHKYIQNPMILVISKKDVLPKSVKENKLMEWLDQFHLNVVDVVFISSHKNYHFDRLYGSIMRHKKSKQVYVVGNTNAGKSTLINRMIRNYSLSNTRATTSYMPSTTLEMFKIELNDKVTLIDTPGLLDLTNMIHFVDPSVIMDITPNTEVNPRTFQMNPDESLVINDLCRLDYEEGIKNSITVYVANNVKVDKINRATLAKIKPHKIYEFHVKGGQDIVVNGLGWFKIVGEGKFIVKTMDGVAVYKRNKMI